MIKLDQQAMKQLNAQLDRGNARLRELEQLDLATLSKSELEAIDGEIAKIAEEALEMIARLTGK